MTYTFDFSVITKNWELLAQGLGLTLEISALSIVFALLAAVVVVAARASSLRPVSAAATVFVEITRNTPFLIQVFFIFFGMPQFGIRLTPYTAAVLTLSLNGAAYCSEIIRGGILSIPKGQMDAGLALGLGKLQVFKDIVLPPALRAVYPALTSQFVLIMLTSSVASTISTLELTLVGLQIEARTFRSFEIFSVITLVYLATSLALSAILGVVGRLFFSYPTK